MFDSCDVLQVCFEGWSVTNNQIVFCSGCEIGVHQECYGIKAVPEDDWFCDRCSEKLPASEAACALCPISGGALKRCTKGARWAHVVCAQWTMETYYDKGRVAGVDKVLPARAQLRCYLCKQKQGVCMQCCCPRPRCVVGATWSADW